MRREEGKSKQKKQKGERKKKGRGRKEGKEKKEAKTIVWCSVNHISILYVI